jgi:hypothetical protein
VEKQWVLKRTMGAAVVSAVRARRVRRGYCIFSLFSSLVVEYVFLFFFVLKMGGLRMYGSMCEFLVCGSLGDGSGKSCSYIQSSSTHHMLPNYTKFSRHPFPWGEVTTSPGHRIWNLLIWVNVHT